MNEEIFPLSNENLSRYWFCPDDKTPLQINYTRVSRTPYFQISRDFLDVSINNAVAMKKMDKSNIPQAKEIADLFFSNEDFSEIELVSVYCSVCKKKYLAPKIAKIANIIDTGKSIYEAQKSLETKNYGRFRVVDHFGLGEWVSGRRRSGFSMMFWLFYGIRTFFAIAILYYTLGLQFRIGKRWIPIGGIIFVLLGLGILMVIFFNNLLNPIINLIKSFVR